MNRILSTLILFLALIVLTGCSSVLIADDTVLTINSEVPLTASINSLTTDQPGKICDITPNKKYILSIGHNNTNYTIDSFQISNNSLVNIITSDTRIYDVRAAEKGFFYVKDNPSNNFNFQIIWSNLDQTVETIITENYDNVNDNIYAYGADNVIFINNNSEIIFSNSEGRKEKYNLEKQIEVSEIVWSDKHEIGFFTGRDLGKDYFTLYEFTIVNNNLITTVIAKNVLDMDLSSQQDQLAYIIQDKDKVQAFIIPDITLPTSRSQFKEEGIEKIHFNDNDKALYFTKILGVGTRSTLWTYDFESQLPYQLTSPLRISSEIIPLAENNEVFFSSNQSSYLENSDIIISSSYISKLVYTLPKK